MTKPQLLHQHNCQDDDQIVARATDLALQRAEAQGRVVPTSGPPPAWLVALIDQAIAEVL